MSRFTMLDSVIGALLLSKHFRVELPSSDEQVSQRLLTLASPSTGVWLLQMSRSVDLKEVTHGKWRFAIKTIRYGRAMKYDSARVEGVIDENAASGNTIIEGTIRVGPMHFLNALSFFTVMSVLSADRFDLPQSLLAVAAIAVLALVLLTYDYGRLRRLLEDALAA